MSISLVRRCLKAQKLIFPLPKPLCIRSKSSASHVRAETDSCGIPIHPTWSVNELISSYPTPTITSATLKRLHELSALIPPVEGTTEHGTLKREMEDLVKLVEAVKLVDLSDDTGEGSAEGLIPDGRVWAEGTGIQPTDLPPAEADGKVTAYCVVAIQLAYIRWTLRC